MAKGRESETRRRILDAAYDLFYRKGFARVGVDDVAGCAGITKKSFYYHFASKDALLAAVLENQHKQALDRIAGWAARLRGSTDEFLNALFAALADWAARPRWEGAGFTRLVMELADLPGHPARAIARRHKAAIEQWLAGEFGRRGVADPAKRASQIMLLVEGCVSLMLIHGKRAYAEAAVSAAKELAGLRRRVPKRSAGGQADGLRTSASNTRSPSRCASRGGA